MSYRRVAALKTADEFRNHLAQSHIDLAFDADLQTRPDAPLAQPYRLRNGFVIGNRFCVLPMEGLDCTTDSRPTELTLRRSPLQSATTSCGTADAAISAGSYTP